MWRKLSYFNLTVKHLEKKNINNNLFQAAIYFTLAIVSVATASPARYAPSPVPAALKLGPAKPYSYAYEVVDPAASGNAYGHRETSDGNGLFEGEYRVVLPDTRTQIVR